MKLLNKFVSRGRRTASRILGGKAIIVWLPAGNSDRHDPMYQLGRVGTFFWKQLEDEPPVSDIINRFMKKYSIGRKEAEDQVTVLIRRLRKVKLIEMRKRRDKAGRPWLR